MKFPLFDRWEVESPHDLRDLAPFPAFTLCFFAIRYVLDRFVFESVGRKRILSQRSRHSGDTQKLQEVEKTHIKFKESSWKFLYYLTASLFAYWISYEEPWFSDTRLFWAGPDMERERWPNLPVKGKLTTFYCFMTGFYFYSILALLFWETRRKDFGLSMTHHLATASLIVGSYFAGFTRICSIVIFLHDPNDVFLELAKLCKYCRLETLSSSFFLVFALSWVWLRLWCYPRYIIYSTSYQILRVLDKKEQGLYGPPLYYIFNFLLILLLVLHIYWWILIFRVLWKVVMASSYAEDNRSDDEDDD